MIGHIKWSSCVLFWKSSREATQKKTCLQISRPEFSCSNTISKNHHFPLVGKNDSFFYRVMILNISNSKRHLKSWIVSIKRLFTVVIVLFWNVLYLQERCNFMIENTRKNVDDKIYWYSNIANNFLNLDIYSECAKWKCSSLIFIHH